MASAPPPPTQPKPPSPAPQPQARSLRDLMQGMVLGGLLVAIAGGILWLVLARASNAQIVVHGPPAAQAAPVQTSATAPTAPTAPTPAPAPSPTPEAVTVFVSGAVARPGVYMLPGGARVVDALEAAGGALPTAASNAVNLAILLHDEAQIYVPLLSEAPSPPAAGTDGTTRGLSVDIGAPHGPPINLNSASSAELESLPGIGPAKAQAIIANRPYATVDELDRVPGIGAATLEELRPLVSAP